MPDLDQLIDSIAAGRAGDPLAPTTVLVPSHVAALQLRRRLAEATPFAAVRFEPLARVAELLGAGNLAVAGRVPLARPIADYVAEQIALESRGALAGVRDLPGYARVLRQLFRRLRRGGITSSADIAAPPAAGHLPEVLRLYDRFREATAAFYDEDDLLDAAAAAVRSGGAGALADLGAVYALPEIAQSASGAALLEALQHAASTYTQITEPAAQPSTRFVLAPDPASEAREAAREAVAAIEAGVPLHEIAIIHGAGSGHRPLLREALAAAGIPAAMLPGTPLIETPAGRAVFALAMLPERDYSRTATMDLFAVAPLRAAVPGTSGPIRSRTTAWDRVSRDAGVTHGRDRWSAALAAFIAGRDADLVRYEDDETRRQRIKRQREDARELQDVMARLAERMEPLRQMQSAAAFIAAFKSIVNDYFAPDAATLDAVMHEIEQLGTVAAVGGSFSLASFARALRANLEAAAPPDGKFGRGVFVSGYRAAAGLRFRYVILCGAHEGGFPPGPGADSLIEDAAWAEVRREHPYIEDAALRIERSAAAAQRAIAAAGGGELVWCSPLYEPGGTREFYPAPLMVDAASQHDPAITTGSALRRRAAAPGWLRRGPSPLAMQLAGPIVDVVELRLREAISLVKQKRAITHAHRLWQPAQMIAARRGEAFTEWDGNLSTLSDDGWLQLQSAVSPTSLEKYSVCGFRYLCSSLLKLGVVEEPEGREMMDAAERGTLIHGVLETFFKEEQARGRPAVGEAWTAADGEHLLALTDTALAEATQRGLTGLAIYAGHERRTIRADLLAFLEEDTAFRRETGAVPAEFEAPVPEVTIAGVRLRGYVDRIDRTPDGRCAWVIDYKTGSAWDADTIKPDDPFAGGKKLQLPTYLGAAGDATQKHAMYWFMTQKGDFKRVVYDPTPETEAAFARTLGAIVTGIRQGAFPAVSGELNERFGKFDNCGYCDFTRICSRRRDDAFTEKSGDPDMEPWLHVAEAAAIEVPE
jgi:RecB family exonuclease